jgi:ribosome-associated protein
MARFVARALKNTKPKSPRRPSPDPTPSPESAQADPLEKSRRLALLAAQAGLEKKARDVQIVDVTGKVDYADYVVIMTGQSDRHVAAIAGEVDAFASRAGSRPLAIEGLPAARWVLVDLVDVVVHVLVEEARALYDLDGLWLDAGRLRVPAPR